MGTIDKKSDALDDIDVKLTQALDAVKAARGQRPDRMGEFCKEFGIYKQSLAIGIIFEADGDISQVELAQKLNIDERTLRKRNWRKVRTLLKNHSLY